MEHYLSQLNPQQREAVEYMGGPQLVIAGAGSGKTRVLTYKIVHLLAHGFEPYRIVALTFTNKAAREMRERIEALVGHDTAKRLWMGTFHSIFGRILRQNADRLGFKPSFTIYDAADSKALIKTIIKDMNLDDKVYKASTVQSAISMAKNALVSPERYAADADLMEADRRAKRPLVHEIYRTYRQRCKVAGAMDFDDLLYYTNVLLRDNPDVRHHYQEFFRYVLVDEYQDTNFAQHCIVTELCRDSNSLTMVGDDAQSIYSFRGANIDNILDFQKKFPLTRLFKLERNYRSTRNIVSAASSLMKHNRRQIAKEVYSEEAEGDRILYHPCYSDKEEAMVVAKEIDRIKRQDGCEYDAFAILYRTNAQSRSFEDELRKRAIPYIIYGGLSFYQRKEIKDILAYFRLVVNPDDGEALRRIINYPARGIGNTTLQRLIDCASEDGVSLWEVISHPGQHATGLGKAALSKLIAFRELIDRFAAVATEKDAFETGREIVKESGLYAELYKNLDPESVSKQENLEEFLAAMQAFVEEGKETGDHVMLADYLQEVALITDQDRKDDDTPKVKLMTVHASKGLEFANVFVVGLEENIFPSPMASDTGRGLEEERRLLYVAITRAERRCIITNAQNRFRFGSMQFDSPSRFINDIDPRYLTQQGDSPASSGGFRQSQGGDNFRRSSTGNRSWDDNFRSQQSSRWQNSKPVASQFRAEPQPKITQPRRPEPAVDPLSPRTRQQLLREGGNWRRLDSALTSGGRAQPVSRPQGASPASGSIHVGSQVEHPRFGRGQVVALTGSGDDAKATVEFANVGVKKLLLKFARLTVLS